MSQADPIVIVAAKRTPIGNFNGYFKETTSTALGSAAIHSVIETAGMDVNDIDEVIMGCVLPAGLGQAPARQASIGADIPTRTPCSTINKMCGSGMKAIMLAHDAIAAGSINTAIAGGMENMTRAPYLLSKARFGYRIGHQEMFDHMMLDGLEDAYKGGSMGAFAEICAEKFNFTRKEQDAFALASFERAKNAADTGAFKAEITPITAKTRKDECVINQDEGPQTIKPEKIPQLKPAFKKDGTVTAANSSSISDGASAALLMRRSQADALGLKPLATIIAHSSHAQEPDWFTTAPIGAIQTLFQKTGWSANDVDLYEINEAFAVVTMAAMKELNLQHERVNINGGACVLGHPIGATGARIVTTLLHSMQQHDVKRGIAALCIGGGEATAIAVERE